MIKELLFTIITGALSFSAIANGQFHPLITAITENEAVPASGIETEMSIDDEVLAPAVQLDVPNVPDLQVTPDMKVLFEEMTLVQVLSEEYARIESVCAGIGLNNISPAPDGPRILIPNAGDLSVEGSNVAIKLTPDGEITFIPRVQGQRIRIPIDVGDKLAGWEVDSLTLDEAMHLMAADKLVWTAKGFGPYDNGHGLPGHIAECDPRYTG